MQTFMIFLCGFLMAFFTIQLLILILVRKLSKKALGFLSGIGEAVCLSNLSTLLSVLNSIIPEDLEKDNKESEEME